MHAPPLSCSPAIPLVSSVAPRHGYVLWIRVCGMNLLNRFCLTPSSSSTSKIPCLSYSVFSETITEIAPFECSYCFLSYSTTELIRLKMVMTNNTLIQKTHYGYIKYEIPSRNAPSACLISVVPGSGMPPCLAF